MERALLKKIRYIDAERGKIAPVTLPEITPEYQGGKLYRVSVTEPPSYNAAEAWVMIANRYFKAVKFCLNRFIITKETAEEVYGYHSPVIVWQWVECNSNGEALYELPGFSIPALDANKPGQVAPGVSLESSGQAPAPLERTYKTTEVTIRTRAVVTFYGTFKTPDSPNPMPVTLDATMFPRPPRQGETVLLSIEMKEEAGR